MARPGALDERITIQRYTSTTDDMGGQVHTWADLDTVWADMAPVGGSESWEEMRTTGMTRFRAIIRWQEDGNGQPKFTNLDRVTWRGREYAIEAVMPRGSRKSFIELALVENEAS